MTKRVEIVQYDHEWNATETQQFEYVEDAIAWAEAKAGQTLHNNDTQIGIELLDQATFDSIDQTGQYPLPGHPIWQIHGLDDGQPRELLEDDWRGDE